MTLHDVENMSAADLKAKRTEILESLGDVPPGELIARYVQARTDAKMRDEKLADQAKTLDVLRLGLTAAKEHNDRLSTELSESQGILDNVRESAKQVALADKTALGEAVASLAEMTANQEADATDFERRIRILIERAKRFKTVATSHHAAVSQAAKLLNDALAAYAVDQADQGE